jgi:hypothetical protein
MSCRWSSVEYPAFFELTDIQFEQQIQTLIAPGCPTAQTLPDRRNPPAAELLNQGRQQHCARSPFGGLQASRGRRNRHTSLSA